jgi:hypothetical protein
LSAHGKDVPLVVITGMNRHGEDMAGLQVGRAMQEAWPGLAIIYLAALWRGALCLRRFPHATTVAWGSASMIAARRPSRIPATDKDLTVWLLPVPPF